MRKLGAAAVICMFLAGGLAWAGHGDECPGKDRAKVVDERLEKLTKKLDLTADQQKKVRTALESKWQKADAVRQDSHQKMTTIHDEYQKSLDTVLDAKQKEKLAEFRKKKHDKKKHKHGDCCLGEECPMQEKS